MLHLIIGRLSYALLRESETQTQCAVLIAVADDAEVADFACILHMCPNACASVIIAHAYNAQGVACIGRQLAKVNTLGNILAGYEFSCYRQMLRNDFVNSYSHEYKTPIASIKGFAQLLLEAGAHPALQ